MDHVLTFKEIWEAIGSWIRRRNPFDGNDSLSSGVTIGISRCTNQHRRGCGAYGFIRDALINSLIKHHMTNQKNL